MNIEKIDRKLIVKMKVYGWIHLLKCKLEQWFPTKYTFRVIKTSIVVEEKDSDHTATEHYEIIVVWENQGKCFGKRVLNNDHCLKLPEFTPDGWTSFTYEIQRRPSENWDARWKSLGYLQYTCVS